MSAPGFWNNQKAARATVGELKALNTVLKPLNELISSAGDVEAMIEMAREDDTFATELPSELTRLEGVLADLELKALLNGPNDACGAIMTFNARDGGVDAND